MKRIPSENVLKTVEQAYSEPDRPLLHRKGMTFGPLPAF
jgi:hypothetical protein